MSKKKVLFFDDEEFISVLLARQLELFEWDVTFVSSINDLFERIIRTNKRYDIVIMDIMAPVPNMENEYINFTKNEIDEMDEGINTGIVLAKKIWEFEKEIPILFLSAKQANAIPQLPKTCIFDFIRKPERAIIISDKLLELINK